MSGQTVNERINENLRRFGQKPFIRLLTTAHAGTSGPYAGVIQRCLNWVKLYRERGLGPGDRIVVILPHGINLYVAYLGAVLAGCVPTMFHFPSPKLSREAYLETLGLLLKSAHASLVVTYDDLAPDIRQTIEAEHMASQVCTEADVSQGPLADVPIALPRPNDIAFLQYSSGTTGLKKGVGITHQQLLTQIDSYAKAIELRGDDVIVSWLPLYHDMGLIACFWLPFLTATPLIAMSPFDWVARPGMLWEVVSKQRPTLCWLPNFAYKHMVKSISDKAMDFYDLRSLRGIINCSEPVLANSHECFVEKFAPCGLNPQALWTCYAMAENTFAVTQGGCQGQLFVDCIDREHFARTQEAKAVDPEDSRAQKLVSSGTALPDTKIQIRDGEGTVLPERRQGEIVIHSPSLMSGYFGKGTEAIEDGWFATGDLGYLADGELVVTGRKKDMIIIAGKNIYPQDIEAVVSDVDGVIPGRCVALGLASEDEGTEDLLVIAESHCDEPWARQELKQRIADQVARSTEVVLRDVRIVDHRWLKKSSSGKIARAANLERYLVELAPVKDKAVSAATEDESKTCLEIRRCLDAVLGDRSARSANELFANQSLVSSGILDSLTLVSLIVELETHFHLSIPPERQTDLASFDSIERIEALLKEIQEGHTSASQIELTDRRLSVRVAKTTAFVQCTREVDLLVIGSSRVDGLSAQVAKEFGYTAYNLAVNSANAEDWWCLLRFALDHAKVPIKRVLLGVDIEAFNGFHSPDQRLITCPLLRPYLVEEDVDEADELYPADRGLSERIADLDPERRHRFQSVFSNLRLQQATQQRDFDYDGETGDLFFRNRSLFQVAYQKRLSLKIEGLTNMADLGAHQRQTEMRLQHFDRLFPRRVQYFESFVELCAERGISLTCFLTPMHPLLKMLLTQRTSYTERIEDFKALFKRVSRGDCELFDCSEPSLFSGNAHDFRDELHVGPFNSDRLMRRLLASHKVSTQASRAQP